MNRLRGWRLPKQMIFRQFFDAESSTYTYLVGDPATRQAVLIDPVLEQVDRDLQFVRELGPRRSPTSSTRTCTPTTSPARGAARAHRVHGGGRRGRRLVRQPAGEPRRRGARRASSLFACSPRPATPTTASATSSTTASSPATRCSSAATAAPTSRTATPAQLFDSITRVLFALPDETLVYPAHDYNGRTVTSVAEEKRHNPRLAGQVARGVHRGDGRPEPPEAQEDRHRRPRQPRLRPAQPAPQGA